MTGLNKDGDALIGRLNPDGLIKQFQGDARLMPQNIVALSREVLKLRGALMSAKRYVEAHGHNADNHPQSRDFATQLVETINAALAE